MSLTGLVFLAGFLGVATICLVRHPIWGLYLYVAVFYLDPPGRWWGASLPDLRWSFLAAAVTLVSLVIHRRSTERKPWLAHAPVVLFTLFVLIFWLQSPFALTGEEHTVGLTIFSKYLIVIYMVYALIDSRERLANFLHVHALGGLYLGWLAYSSYSGGRMDGIGGPGIDDANSLGMQMATAVYAAGAWFLSDQSWKRWIAAVSVAFAVNLVVMTGSRGSFLAVLAGGLTFFLFRPRGTLRVALLSAVAAMALMLHLASDFFWERIQTIGVAVENTEEADKSAFSRLVIIEKQWQMAKDYPLGVGHKGTAFLSYTYIPAEYHSTGGGGRSSHNTLMSALVDQGFLGLAIWLAILFTLARTLYRQRRMERRDYHASTDWYVSALAAGLVSIFVGGMFAPYLRAEVFVWYLALTVALSSLRPVGQESRVGLIQSPGVRPA